MLPLLLVSVLVTGGFEAGGHIGVTFPSSGLENTHDAAALFGISLSYATAAERLMLEYGYTGLQAKQTSPYRFDINRLSFGYGHEFAVGRPAAGTTSYWGFEASASAGLGLLSRAVGSAREAGRSPFGIVGLGFFQRQGHSRLSLGLDNFLFGESRPAGSSRTVSVTYLIGIKGGVAYVF
ncbi:hypothetical protein FJY68_11820 [candidate division WOR-3 bacterium]|uniref:Uncharacterized protein n=1 Tax=candidate division WOR-3 bacterium TaxID=2052148 RepID=A0A937XJJ3_UNCW3|nr:hypothetical protein [candidate division WOR-3 bacterium]